MEIPQHIVAPVWLVLSQVFLHPSKVLLAFLILRGINAAVVDDGNYSHLFSQDLPLNATWALYTE